MSDSIIQPMGFTKQAVLTGKEKAAILMGELGIAGSSEIMKYFSTEEIKKIRKAMQNLPKYNIYQASKENKVLEDACKFGISHRICSVSPELLSSAHYSQLHEKENANNYIKNLAQNPDAIANVLSVWLKED